MDNEHLVAFVEGFILTSDYPILGVCDG